MTNTDSPHRTADDASEEPPYEVGDKVTTGFNRDSRSVVREVTRVERDYCCESGWRVSADGGKPCECCGRPFSYPIRGIDSEWYAPAR